MSAPKSQLEIDNARLRRSYSYGAPLYAWLVRGFRARRRRSLALLDAQPGERVLIVGAGTGEDLDYLPPGVQVTAIDLTPAMLAKLTARATRLGRVVEARVMDGHQLEFPAASFDAVILHLILAVIPDPGRCAREVSRVLAPGGRVVILDKFVPDNQRPSWILRCLAPVTHWLGTELTRQLGPILAGTGLVVIEDHPAGLGGYFRIVLARKKGSHLRV